MNARTIVALSALAAILPHPTAAQEPGMRGLTDVVERALEVHPSLVAAREAATAAGAGVAEARAAWLPGLAAQGSAVRFQEPMVVAPIHAFDPADAPDFDRTLVQGSLGLSYTLFDGGRRRADVRRARAVEGASRADLDEARAELIERTAQAYLALLTARDIVAAQDAREAALAEERARVQHLLDEGSAPRLELLRADAELADARAAGEGARRALALAAATLGHLLDEDPAALVGAPLAEPALPAGVGPPEPSGGGPERATDQQFPRTEPIVATPEPSGGASDRATDQQFPRTEPIVATPEPSDDAPDRVTAPGVTTPAAATVHDASPRVAAARREASAAAAISAAARSAWMPTVDATAGYNVFSGAETSATGEWQAGLRLSYPLFTGGARNAAVDAAAARARAADARVEVVREQVALAADRAGTAEAEARARMEALAVAVARYDELVRVERLALSEGSGVQSDYLRAEAGLHQARAGLATARRDVLDARIAWARAVGSLDLNWIAETMASTEERP